jgi:hypothetical protein
VGITPGDAKDRTIWGQYNGMREGGSHLLLDIDMNKRDASGFWTILRGRNLGLESNELRLEHQPGGFVPRAALSEGSISFDKMGM